MKKLEPQPEVIIRKSENMYKWKSIFWWGYRSDLLDERLGEGRVARLIDDTWYILEEPNPDNIN